MPILTEEERVGTLLAGRYQLDAILGRGGTGVVFDATHNWTGRQVAVKLLKPEYSRDASLTRRFLQEARAAAGLNHPNVVQVLDMGNEVDGTVHLVLERLEGESLGSYLEGKEALEGEELLSILVPIMDALRLAHDRGIIHRDLKPDNIYLHRDDTGRLTPKLLDFGMAKMVDAAWGHSTQSGTLIGTPFYMSPEQAEGRPGQGPATDVWSMGVILYRCLTGALPFYASTPTKLLMEIVTAQSTPTAERGQPVPPALAAVVDRCLVADLDERWPSMAALIEALQGAAADDGVPFPALPDAAGAPPAAAFDPGPRAEKRDRRPRALLIGAALAVALAGGLGMWIAQRGSPEDPTISGTSGTSGSIESTESTNPAEPTDTATTAAGGALGGGPTRAASPPSGLEPGARTANNPGEGPTEAQPPPEGESPEADDRTAGSTRPRGGMRNGRADNGAAMAHSQATMGASVPHPTMEEPPAAEGGTGTMRLPGVAEDW